MIITGLCSISCDSFTIGSGIVALKNSVCRFDRNVPKHAPDVGQKSHVEHAIGFVEHEVLEAAQLRVRLPEMIEQPARRADDDVDAAAEGVLLRAHADAAVHREAADRRVNGEVLQIFDNLRRELARRGDDERARRARTARAASASAR